MGLLLPQSPDTSSALTSGTAKTFKDHGFDFIPVRKAHLDFFSFVFGEEVPPIEECVGNSMVDRWFIPVGFCMAWIRPEGTVTAHAYFGEWLKTYPKDILRGIKPVMDKLRKHGVSEIWAVADERVPGSDTLCKWLGGVPSGQVLPGEGEYWRIDLTKSKI